MDARRRLLATAPVWIVAASLGPVRFDPRGTATDSPEGLMRCFESTYEGRDADAYGMLFTTDFRFQFGDPDLRARYPGGWTREDEIASAQHLFEGFRDASGVYRRPAQRIDLSLRPFSVRPDPEKPDSAAWYQIVIVPAVHLAIDIEGGGFLVENDRHDFWLVRGDVARLDAGQPADPDHWYIRRWVEKPNEALAVGDPDAVAGASADSTRSGAIGIPATNPGVSLGVPLRTAIQDLRPNPSLGTMALSLSLAGRGSAQVTVVDVAGRLRWRRSLGALGPGSHQVVLDLGSELGPGVYFIRLIEAERQDTRRVVIAP
jgi:hypothetical protein